MKKSELIEEISSKYPTNQYLTKKNIETGIDAILKKIEYTLLLGDRVELRGFCTFSTKEMSPRQARNPKTGEIINVGLKDKIAFRASETLKKEVNRDI